MRFFRDIPIQRKTTLVLMLASTITLLMAATGWLVFQWYYAEQLIMQDLKTHARIIAENSLAAVSFDNPNDAASVLSAHKADPRMLTARIYATNGTVFAHYGAPEPAAALPPGTPAAGFQFRGPHLLFFEPLVLDDKRIGTLYLRYDFQATRADLTRPFLLILGVLLPSALALSYLLSLGLQRVISRPILKLAETAKLIAKQQDYTVRAERPGCDELGTLTDAFNHMLTRIHEQDVALRQSEAQKQTILSAIHAGIVIIDAQTHDILDANDAALKLIGQPRDDVIGHRCHSFICPTEEGKCPITDQHSTVDNSERVLLDGRGNRIPILKSVVPITFQGRPSLLEYFLDITERKRADAELQTLHQQLLETSRLAGMGEVATGVIHNVGNVLNSINVSCTLVLDRLRQSKAPVLDKLAALFQEQGPNLGHFLAHDPRGQQIPAYMGSVAKELREEQSLVLREVDLLRTNVDHVKDIVSMQQNYAHISGVVETVAVAQLVEDALQMNAAALARHDIRIIREFAPVPDITVEKHKVLQILINLICNAKHALDEGRPPAKELRLKVSPNGGDRVKIEVADNGVGIAPENLTRIFAHGFTTRSRGHGFGLHSGALAAKELGGSLVAHSEGLGCGAIFCLELPLHPPAEGGHA